MSRSAALVALTLLACGPSEPDPEEVPEWLQEEAQEHVTPTEVVEDHAPPPEEDHAPPPEQEEPFVEPPLLVVGEPPLAVPAPVEGAPETEAQRIRARQLNTVGMVGMRIETIVETRGPTWALDTSAPFTVSFGRGSGRMGLTVVDLDETGVARISRWVESRARHFVWRVQLDVDALRAALDTLTPTAFKHNYRQPDVMDGTQWVLDVRQGSRRHVVYCDNAAPERLTAFSATLDAWFPRRIEPSLGSPLPLTRDPQSRPDADLWAAQRLFPETKLLGDEPRAYVRTP